MQAFLGVYVYAGGEIALAQKCFLRARLLIQAVHGEDHPYTATLDVGSSILTIVQSFTSSDNVSVQ